MIKESGSHMIILYQEYPIASILLEKLVFTWRHYMTWSMDRIVTLNTILHEYTMYVKKNVTKNLIRCVCYLPSFTLQIQLPIKS